MEVLLLLDVDKINGIIKMSAIYVCSFLVFSKIINDKSSNSKRIITVILSMIISILYNVAKIFIPVIIDLFFVVIVFSVILAYFTKNKINYCIVIFCISIAITYIFYYISLFLSGIILKVFNPSITYENHIIFILTTVFQLLMTFLFIRMKRFKNGISFLQYNLQNKYIDLMVILISATVILIYIIFGMSYATNNSSVYPYIFFTLVLLGMIIGVWIQKNIIANHIKKIDKKYIAELENVLEEKEKELDKIKYEAFNSARAVHKISNKLSAFELSLTNLNTEFGGEIFPFMEKSKVLSKEFLKDIQRNEVSNQILPLTNIWGIDEMFQYMSQKAKEKDIDFNLKIKPSINYMVDKIVNQSKLEMLVGDLITNAIMSINENKAADANRNILVILGQTDNYYSLCVQDSGINFEIETLLNLGLKPTSTHSQNGGNGIGYMTIFEVLNEYKASLIIEERNPKNKVYTKSITICFDHKNEYRIKTHRAKEINLYNTNQRINVEEL